MGIKYIVIPEQRKTIAILPNTKMDLIRKINKAFRQIPGVHISDSKYLLNEFYKASVVCHKDDEYDEDVGKREAKKKVMDKYHKALDEGYKNFMLDMYDTVSHEITRMIAFNEIQTG